MWSGILETVGALAVLASVAVQISARCEPFRQRITLHRALHAVGKRLLGRIDFARAKPRKMDINQ